MPIKVNIIDHDKYGHCIACSRNMITERIVDHKPVKSFLPTYTEEQFLLDDGSKMRVAFCLKCKSQLKDTDHSKLMKKVFNGWKKEVERLDWPEDKKKEYLARYEQRTIVTKTEGKKPEHLKELLEKFHKDKK